MNSLFRKYEELVLPDLRKSELRINGGTRYLKRSAADLAKPAAELELATSSTSRPEALVAETTAGTSGRPVGSVILRKAQRA